jgi:hypothetical protein
MSGGYGSFCTRCGAPLGADDEFCTHCGTPRQHVPSGPGVAAAVAAQPPAGGARPPAGQVLAVASRAYGVVGQVAGLAGLGLALPWQRVAGAGQADIGALLSAAAVPGARRLVGASLKRPGLAMAATTVLDVAVAVVTGGTSALYKALPRLVLGGATSVLSLATGRKAGNLRRLTGIMGGLTAAAQLGFAVYTLITGLDSGTSAYALVPQVVAMLSSLVMAAKTMAVALRRRP